MKIAIPKKSASLLLLRPHKSPHSIYNYQILLLRRTSSSSFSNMYAFPGGLYDASKDQHPSSEVPFYESLRNTAYRETLEEIGLWFFSDKKELYNIEEIRNEIKGRGLDWYNYNIIKSRFNGNIKKIDPLIRLITIPYLNPRYDTQFFLVKLEAGRTFNWKNYFHGGDLNSAWDKWDNIDYDRKEFCDIIWSNPLEIIKKHYEEGLALAPPQYIILNILSHFTQIDTLEAFLHIKNKVRDPFVYPNMLCLRNTEDVIVAN